MKDEIEKIVAAMESRIADPKRIDTARNKLLHMDEKQTRLLSVLSDRILVDDTSVGASIAFLLVAVLIALS